MNTPKEPSIFYSPKELWCCRTRTLNAVSGTVEYHTHTGFITQTEAEKTLEETEAVFQKDWKNRKMCSSCFCTFTEYLEDWFEKLPSDISSTTKVKYHWIIYHLILPRIETDPPLGHIDANYLDAVIDACKEYCASAEYAVYKLLYRIATSIWLNGFLPYNLASALAPRKEPRSNVCIYTKEQTQVFLQAVKNDPYSHRLEYDLALFCGLRPGEILGLTYENLHPDSGELDIHKQYTKDGVLPTENASSRYSYKDLDEERFRSLKVPLFVKDELALRQMENNHYFLEHPDKKDPQAFCISSRGSIKTLVTLNTRLKHITKDCGLPLISMYDLCDMFVWTMLENNCSPESIQKLTGGVEIDRILAAL